MENVKNNCLLTINKFNDSKSFISGNRCKKGSGGITETKNLPNMYKYKFERLFDMSHYQKKSLQRNN